MSSPGKTLGVEVSANFLRAVTVDANGKVSEPIVEHRFDGSDPLDRIVEFVRTAADKLGPVDAVGVAIPGLINRQNGGVAYSANIPETSSLNIAEAVGTAAGVPVILENDANAAAVAEYNLGAGKGSRSMFYATIGGGVGGAFVLDGKLWEGAGGYAGEFGYIAIDSEGTRLEELASTPNIVRRTRNRFNRDSTSSLGKLSEERIGIAEIVKAAEEGDEFARLMLERTGAYVGTAIANVINLLNLETIVVGGEITGAKDVVIEAITNRAKELSFARAFAQTQILAATVGDDAAAIGAALIARAKA
ncbi:MAG TPA: ROK family protein [Pyrinomonadaceae bacterium]|nr:ROK family protein [Pyrinomonadaceae bacterium]